jgi:hypothetical protein
MSMMWYLMWRATKSRYVVRVEDCCASSVCKLYLNLVAGYVIKHLKEQKLVCTMKKLGIMYHHRNTHYIGGTRT